MGGVIVSIVKTLNHVITLNKSRNGDGNNVTDIKIYTRSNWDELHEKISSPSLTGCELKEEDVVKVLECIKKWQIIEESKRLLNGCFESE